MPSPLQFSWMSKGRVLHVVSQRPRLLQSRPQDSVMDALHSKEGEWERSGGVLEALPGNGAHHTHPYSIRQNTVTQPHSKQENT